MITEIENALPSCWIKGSPTKKGLYLIRFESCGNPWYFLFQCVIDPTDEYKRMLFLDHRGGGYKWETRRGGKMTHYCKATADNFGLILNSLAEHTFNKEKMKYERL